MKKILIIVLVVVLVLGVLSQIKKNRSISVDGVSSVEGRDTSNLAASSQFTSGEAKYVSDLTKALNLIITKSQQARAPKKALTFGGNVFLAHGSYIPYFSTKEMTTYVDALKEAGVKRVEIYPDPSAWIQNKQDVIKKYDVLIKYVKDSGLDFAISAQFGPENYKYKDYADFKAKVIPALGQIAEKYQPTIFTVIHEPTTMEARLKIKASPAEWDKFVAEASALVKSKSPNTKVAAGVEWYEKSYSDKWMDDKNLDIVALNIYDINKLSVYNDIVQLAKKNGKKSYIAETWRAPYQDPVKKAGSLEEGISKDIGNEKYKALDQKWMEALVAWANALELEGVTPFWSMTYFKYETTGDTSAISYKFNRSAADALMKGKRTDTFNTFKSLAKQFGR